MKKITSVCPYCGAGCKLKLVVENNKIIRAEAAEGERGVKCWITVRVEVDADKPEFPSVTPRVPAAVWGEREVRDMYGLQPIGLPDERRLVLPDDWPDDLYPLRKDSMDYRNAQRPPLIRKPTNLLMSSAPKRTMLCRLVPCT